MHLLSVSGHVNLSDCRIVTVFKVEVLPESRSLRSGAQHTVCLPEDPAVEGAPRPPRAPAEASSLERAGAHNENRCSECRHPAVLLLKSVRNLSQPRDPLLVTLVFCFIFVL